MKRILLILAALATAGTAILPLAPASASVSPFVSVSAGRAHSCGITTTGAALCWGRGTEGQLGDGLGLTSAVPVAVVGGATWRSISAGAFHTCGVLSTGQAMCWGANNAGQLGDGSNTSSLIPVFVSGGSSWISISAGGFTPNAHTCGIQSTGTLWCWGNNANGQLGNGSPGNTNVPVQEALLLPKWARVSAGSSHTCAIASTALAYCWGANFTGQLGIGSTAPASVPTPVASGGPWLSISAGGVSPAVAHTCGIRPGGLAFCWGGRPQGQLGVGSGGPILAPGPAVPGGFYSIVSAGGLHTCGVRPSGQTLCWGGGTFGQIGNSFLLTVVGPAPVSFGPLTTVDAGGYHNVALDSGLTAWNWGRNNFLQLAALVPPVSPIPI